MPNYEIAYILMILSVLVTLIASIYIRINYSKYRKIDIKKRMTGYDVARLILDSNNLQNILILEVSGELTDHYDPTKKVIRLSHDIYHDTSISSCSVASHECGHAIQDKEGYSFLVFRNKIIPLVNFSSKAGYVAILIGFLFSLVDFLWIGILLELVILVFQLITLPVEFNASNRAIKQLRKLNIVTNDELDGSKKMLTSAALTYVAGVMSNLLQILRLVILAGGRDDR